MRTLILLIFPLLYIVPILQAQYVPMNIPLTKNGTNLKNAWAGGLNLPQFSSVDLNNDGIKDLVAYDRSGRVASTFINQGTVGVVDYVHAPAYMNRFPKFSTLNFMLLRDYNCDGIEDVFVYNNIYGQGSGLAVWEGSYDANDTIKYTLITNKLGYYLKGGNPFEQLLFIPNADIPVIDDVDNDGDIDVLSFTSSGQGFLNHIHWFKNMSVENGRGCDSLEYVLETECWGLFEEGGDTNRVKISPSIDSCRNNPYFEVMRQASDPNIAYHGQATHSNARRGRDPGASLALLSVNGDGIPEMIIGGIDYTTANVISGVEINDTILITTQDNFYPTYDKPIDIYTFPSMYFLDVNNDGKDDMLAAPAKQSLGGAVMDSVAWYYENTGNNSNMIFDFQQKDFLVGEMLDVGENAFPVLLDYNADGLMDLLIGGSGRCQYGGSYETGMTLLENTGTLTNPAFEYVTNNYAGTDSLQIIGLYPTVGDLDGDGDVDMICGMANGTLSYFENKGGVGNPVNWAPPVHSFFNINVLGSSAPQLVDLDRDTDLDLVIGARDARIYYYENTGTSLNPIFSTTPVTNRLGSYVDSSHNLDFMPFVYDNNGSYELFIGQGVEGDIIHLGNIDGNILGTYDTLSEHYNNFSQGWKTHFSIADLNNDNKPDYILGTNRGGILLLEEGSPSTATQLLESKQKVVHLYPNPTKEVLNIRFLTTNEKNVTISVYNALGQIVLQQTSSSREKIYQLDVSSLTAGVLFLEITAGAYQEVVQFVKL